MESLHKKDIATEGINHEYGNEDNSRILNMTRDPAALQ